MHSLSNGKKFCGELNSVWNRLAAEKGVTGEFSYRLGKLALRLDSIADKIFIKTVKAHAILTECAQLTGQFESELNKSPPRALHLLTRIEALVDSLVKDTHEFRIKAG